MTKAEAHESLHRDIVQNLLQIEEACHAHGLTRITKFTVIVRDPDNDNMCLVVTNEDADGLTKATQVAINNATLSVA